jgi:hypothetical protein
MLVEVSTVSEEKASGNPAGSGISRCSSSVAQALEKLFKSNFSRA